MSTSVDQKDGEYDAARHSSLIQQFRSRLGDKVRPCHSDRMLFKWLKARKLDVDAAETMYLKSMRWRQQVGADSILDDFQEPEVVRLYYPGCLFGCARDGSPVWIELMGRGDFTGILSCVDYDVIMRCMIYRLESLYRKFDELSEQSGRPVDKCLHIMDVTGFSMRHLSKTVLDMYIEILQMLEANYPETLRATYVINAPKLFRMGYDFIKNFLDEQTANKIVLLSDDYQGTLLSLIDADQLPVAFGGRKVDENGDELCQQWICYGGDVPKYYYKSVGRHGELTSLPDEKTLRRETIGQRGQLAVDVVISDANTRLQWTLFLDKSTQLQFSLQRQRRPHQLTSSVDQQIQQQAGEEDETVVGPVKYDGGATGILVQDSATCRLPGTYKMLFYNPSRWYSVTVTYCYQLAPPTDDTSSASTASAAENGVNTESFF